MAIPVASFNFYANGLQVVFEDLSSNIPTSWEWNFGDTNTSTLQNPTHTYGVSGKYKVSLKATNVDGNNTFTYEFVVSTSAIVNQTVETMVKESLPDGFSIPPIELTQSVRKWQMYLQPKVYLPFEVSESDMFDQSKWPGLANVLISKLIVWEQLIVEASKTMMAGVASEGGASSSGGLKKVESGPSVAEWYDSSELWKTIFGGKSDIGFFAEMKNDICIFASRQNISIPEICGKKITTIPFIIGRKSYTTNWCWPIYKG